MKVLSAENHDKGFIVADLYRFGRGGDDVRRGGDDMRRGVDVVCLHQRFRQEDVAARDE